MNHFSCLFFILALLLPTTFSIPIDNGVETEPEIECGAGYIAVNFVLRNNFDGHIYVKGHYNESQCRTDQTGRRTASIRLSFTSCGIRRTRSLNPRGLSVGTVVVITFHPKFITKVDRAYATQCFYMETEKSVAVQLEVSELTSISQTQRVPMPICRYDVLEDEINGPPIRYAIVGQQIYHKWTCETESVGVFCMQINSCYVSDGVAEQVQILDSNGCSIDRYVLQNLEYVNDLVAGQEAHVFKFADRIALYFQCQISITVRDSTTSCVRPICGNSDQPTNRLIESNGTRSFSHDEQSRIVSTSTKILVTTSYSANSVNRSRSRSKKSVTTHDDQEINVWDVQAPLIMAFDVDFDSASALKFTSKLQNPSGRYDGINETKINDESNYYCLQINSFSLLLFFAVGSTLAIAIIIFIFCMRRRSKPECERIMWLAEERYDIDQNC